MRNLSWLVSILLIIAPAWAHWDFLLGIRNGRAAVILPHPHPLQSMSLIFGNTPANWASSITSPRTDCRN